jgi:DNA-binding response OmpR family regulator
MWPLTFHANREVTSRDSDHSPEVLAILGNSRDQITVTEFAQSRHWHLTLVSTPDQGLSSAAEKVTPVILLDRDLAGHEWRSTMRRLAQNHSKPCIILVSPVVDPYLFDEVVRQGGFDVVTKPIEPDELRRIGHLALTFWKRCRASNSPL